MFGQVAQESEGMVFGGSEEAWFIDGLLASSETSEKSLVGGKAGEGGCSVFGELPAALSNGESAFTSSMRCRTLTITTASSPPTLST